MTTRDLGAIYTREWYEHDFRGLELEFELVAVGITRTLGKRRTALDVGCGPGLLVTMLRRYDWDAWGFDGSPHAIAYAKDHNSSANAYIERHDILEKPAYPKRHVVVCTEVAEHLPPEQAPVLVHYCASQATESIVWTAARPGQGGHDHVNEQPPEYWEALFADEGWIVDEPRTSELRARWRSLKRLSHMIRNVQVYR
jgi:SAM-dependent methyltransferase